MPDTGLYTQSSLLATTIGRLMALASSPCWLEIHVCLEASSRVVRGQWQ